MAYSAGLADSRVISQSDSNLLNSRQDENFGKMRRNSSVDDMDGSKRGKGFLYRLVRPWKWHRKKKKSSKTDIHGPNGECTVLCVCVFVISHISTVYNYLMKEPFSPTCTITLPSTQTHIHTHTLVKHTFKSHMYTLTQSQSVHVPHITC